MCTSYPDEMFSRLSERQERSFKVFLTVIYSLALFLLSDGRRDSVPEILTSSFFPPPHHLASGV